MKDPRLQVCPPLGWEKDPGLVSLSLQRGAGPSTMKPRSPVDTGQTRP